MAQSFRLRPPRKYAAEDPVLEFQPPSEAWLEGTWYVTHTSLPLWENKRNVNITYTRLPNGSRGAGRIDDLVKYQPKKSNKIKEVHGVDTPKRNQPSAWEWRGKGWLRISSSRWELLGYGDLADGHQWVVTYFARTMFTPEGIDVYSRKKEGLPPEALDAIKEGLSSLNSKPMKALVGRLYEVTMN